jgi:hypothetical protein
MYGRQICRLTNFQEEGIPDAGTAPKALKEYRRAKNARATERELSRPNTDTAFLLNVDKERNLLTQQERQSGRDNGPNESSF